MQAIIHANVFDGKHAELIKNASIVIDGNIVKEITAEKINTAEFEAVIDAEGKTVIPGLVDNHVHLMFGNDRIDELTVHGVRNARNFLYGGFTSVRDAGGAVYGIKRGIDDGIIEGPRIFPSYAFLSQTSGHGDFRESRGAYRITDHIYTSPALMGGQSYIADGADEMLKGVREQLFLGASQIKIMAGGGLSSDYDPVQTLQYTLEEMKAAVAAASDYGTYVMAHLYTTEAIDRALRAGVRSLEHAHLLDEETAKRAKDQDAYLCPCPNFTKQGKKPQEETKEYDTVKERMRDRLFGSVETQSELINKYALKIVYGTDFIERFTNGIVKLNDFISYEKRFGSFHGLVSATGNAYELSRLTTYQNPYPDGKIGVLEKGAFADLLIVNGNPVEKLSILTEPDNIELIMKDGKVYKNLQGRIRKTEKPDKQTSPEKDL